jgi:hypothetical protein
LLFVIFRRWSFINPFSARPFGQLVISSTAKDEARSDTSIHSITTLSIMNLIAILDYPILHFWKTALSVIDSAYLNISPSHYLVLNFFKIIVSVNIDMLSVIIMNVIMLGIIMLSVVTLNVFVLGIIVVSVSVIMITLYVLWRVSLCWVSLCLVSWSLQAGLHYGDYRSKLVHFKRQKLFFMIKKALA